MRDLMIRKVMPIALVVVGALVLAVWWYRGGPAADLKERLPGADRVEEEAAAGGGPAKWEGKLVKSNGVPSNLAGEWPRFRGPNLDGICGDEIPLARAWTPEGPKVLWNISVGEGFAGAAIWKGRVYVMDYDQEHRADALRCLSLADGQEIWRYTYPVKVKRNHGMSRTMPSVSDKGLVAMSPKCQVICLDPLSGELRWKINLVKDFGTEVPPWYAGQCPLVEADRVILAPGGDALVMAVDLQTGQVVWKTPNPRNWQMTHSSLMPIEFKGRRQYVYCGSGGVSGIAAQDGALLWDTPDWKISIANVPSPLPLPEGRIFLSGGYNAGSMMLQLKETGNKLVVEPVFRLKPTVFGAIQQTPIVYQDHIYGVRQDGQLVCLDLQGKCLWESGGEHRFGNGPFLLAQGLILAMNDNGVLSMAEAVTTGYHQLAQAKVLPGPDSWGPMALAGGRLILRDLNKMICLNVSAK